MSWRRWLVVFDPPDLQYSDHVLFLDTSLAFVRRSIIVEVSAALLLSPCHPGFHCLSNPTTCNPCLASPVLSCIIRSPKSLRNTITNNQLLARLETLHQESQHNRFLPENSHNRISKSENSPSKDSQPPHRAPAQTQNSHNRKHPHAPPAPTSSSRTGQ